MVGLLSTPVHIAIMLKREKITQEEYDKAVATPLVFVKDGTETEDDCMKRVKKAIKNARSTNPLKAGPAGTHDRSSESATPKRDRKRSPDAN